MNTDHDLKKAVLAELDWEPSVGSNHIGVTANGGVVTLTGHVDSYWQKAAAERAVGRVQGVRAIAEEIEVRLPGSVHHNDDDIAKAALDRLNLDNTIPKDAVKIRVQKGHVTLTGEVPWHYQHDGAAHAIRSLMGVMGISNQITVKKRPDTSKIQNDIVHALNRAWFSNDNIKVTANGGEVHLTGSVATWNDRDLAATTAWRASGTTSVVNELHVK
jgi:osmotically-inducible protein OsmY